MQMETCTDISQCADVQHDNTTTRRRLWWMQSTMHGYTYHKACYAQKSNSYQCRSLGKGKKRLGGGFHRGQNQKSSRRRWTGKLRQMLVPLFELYHGASNEGQPALGFALSELQAVDVLQSNSVLVHLFTNDNLYTPAVGEKKRKQKNKCI